MDLRQGLMMEDRLERLKQHLDYLTQELARLKKERDKIEREIELTESALKNSQALYNSRSGAYPEVEPIPKKYDGMSQIDAARRFLAEHENKPFHVREIWATISAEGVISKAKEPWWSLATNLGLQKRIFVAIGNRKATFRLTEEAYMKELEKINKERIEQRLPGINNLR
jgi:hypothetical protein